MPAQTAGRNLWVKKTPDIWAQRNLLSAYPVKVIQRLTDGKSSDGSRVVLLGNVALRLQPHEELTTKKLLRDGENLRVTNSDVANQFLKTEYRQECTL